MSKKQTIAMDYKNRTEIRNGNKIMDIDELTREVNRYDKEFGIKLKKYDMYNDPESYKVVLEARCDMILAKFICIVNGIKLSDWFETDNETGYGTISNPVNPEDPLFTDYSMLLWDKKKKFSTDSLMFRCRFITSVLMKMLDRMDKISGNMCDNRFHYKHSKTEYQIVQMKNIMDNVYLFVQLMIHQNNSYKNIILKMNEYVSYTKNKVDHNKLRNQLNGYVIETRDAMKKSPFNEERFLSDNLCIYNMLKISYMLATNRTDVNVLPKFKHIENATVKHDLSKLIEALGDEIIYSTKCKKYNPMFKAFIEARPSIWSQFYKESKEDDALRIGILALGFSDFVMDDDTMSKFIKEMLKKGK